MIRQHVTLSPSLGVLWCAKRAENDSRTKWRPVLPWALNALPQRRTQQNCVSCTCVHADLHAVVTQLRTKRTKAGLIRKEKKEKAKRLRRTTTDIIGPVHIERKSNKATIKPTTKPIAIYVAQAKCSNPRETYRSLASCCYYTYAAGSGATLAHDGTRA